MKTSNQRGFTVVEILVTLFILAALTGAGWLYWHKSHEDKTPAPHKTNQPTNNQSSNASGLTVPSDYRTYTNKTLDFSVAYPDTWGDTTAMGTTPFMAQTPEVTDTIGSASLHDAFTIAGASMRNVTMNTGKYAATIAVTDDSGNYSWKITSVNPADTTDKVGDTYSPKSVKSASNVTVYDLSWTDEGISHPTYMFSSPKGMITLTLPTLYNNDASPLTDSQLAGYNTIVTNIVKSIRLAKS